MKGLRKKRVKEKSISITMVTMMIRETTKLLSVIISVIDMKSSSSLEKAPLVQPSDASTIKRREKLQ